MTNAKEPSTQTRRVRHGSDRKRVQIEFSSTALKRLQKVMEMSEASSNAEVVRNALRLYDWFLTKREENFDVFLSKDDSPPERVELLW